MRHLAASATVLIFCFSVCLSGDASAQSLFGAEVGIPLSAAVDTLESRGCDDFERNDVGDFSYAYKCLMGQKEVLVAARKDEGSVETAPVIEVSFIAYTDSFSEDELNNFRDKYRMRWDQTFGEHEVKQRTISKTWKWKQEDVRAEIERTTFDSGANHVEVRLRTP